MRKILVIGLLAAATLAAQQSKNDAGQRGTFPLADHHTHLLSPAQAELVRVAPLAPVGLPEDLARLLREREKGWNDKSALAALYTEDSVVYQSRNPTWIRGRPAVSENLAGLFARPYRVTPVAYGVDGSNGYVAGYFTRDVEAGVRHFGHVLLSVRKGEDGAWRIAAETLSFPGPEAREPMRAEQLVAQLDAAGVRRAAVLSTAYWYGSPLRKPVEDEYAKVRAENDWVAGEVARFPDRLVGFCSFNPLKDYALEELERCAKHPRLKGLKLHFGNSGVEVRNPEHVEKVRRVFAAADARRLPVVVHLWTLNESYGREDAEIFLNKILPAAPDITVQIAHFAGGGPGYTDEALAVYAEAIAAGDRRTKNLYFDIATVADRQPDEVLRTFAARIRQVGLRRVLYGTDASPPNPPARQSWLSFRTTVPLTDDEFRAVAGNVAPYLR